MRTQVTRIALALCALCPPLASLAATDVKVAQVPLAKAASQPVPPNLLFILDDSGSMDWAHTPDFVDDSMCRQTNSTTSLTGCAIGMPPYTSTSFNKQYYDPRIRYTPGVKADGTSYPEMNSAYTTGWTQVPTDGYKSSSSKTNLTTGYPDRVWSNGSTTQSNTTYRYPDNSYTSSWTVNGAPYYYNLKPLYCTNDSATNCATAKGGSYLVEIPYRWCSDSSLSTCQWQKTSTYRYPSFNKPETGTLGELQLAVTGWGSGSKKVNSLKFNGTELLKNLPLTQNDVGNNSQNCNAMAQRIVDNQITGAGVPFTISRSGCNVILTAKTPGTWANDTAKIAVLSDTAVTPSVKTYGTDGEVFFTRVDIKPATPKYQVNGSKPSARTDCVAYGDGCSYTEEMTNFANWYAYYRTRMQMMKSAASQAFKDIDNSFRVGFTQINNLTGKYIKIRAFDSGQRTAWYNNLLSANPGSGTPLRGALAFAGQIYAGKQSSTDDPVQYSCQQNFTLLTTDGYWNGNSSGSGVVDLSNAVIKDQDGGSTPRPYYQGPSAGTVPSLADVAMYYYNTDLRRPDLGNCTSPLTGADVCENNVPVSADDKNNTQHMSTFTLGLGIDGNLRYRKDYKTATSGDFFNIKNGSLDWPPPTNDAPQAIDDLWHAAVNGRGQYFSAQDPAVLVSSLKEALANISAQYGSGSAAATSTAEPVNGDNFAYVATYTTGKWIGNLEARQIDINTGKVALQAQWCAESIAADPARNLTACTGTMPGKVAAESDTRKIYLNNGGNLAEFNTGNLSAHLSKFDVTKLNQYPTWSAEYKAEANADKLVRYLRGQWGYDMRTGNEFRLFREREATLSDFVGSAPKYVCRASGDYEDPGYQDFRASLGISTCTRTPMIYIGGNDGMLHAFNANTGQELWAFVPTPALSEMWRLADSTYGNNHRFLVDGSITVEDVCISNCGSSSAVWKTVLVGALAAGVVQGNDPDTGAPLSGYFAIDVTDPNTPKMLWEVTSASSGIGNRIGFSFARPWLLKIQDGAGTMRWVALLSSGFEPSSGTAALIAVDAYTGATIRTIDLTGADGFSRFSPAVVKGGKDHTVTKVYGGDLAGNIWRIDPNTGAVARIVAGTGQPFTTEPELTTCNGKTSIYIGSGKFIEAADMTNKSQQTFYGIVDEFDTLGTLSSPKSALQSLSVSGNTISGTSSSGSSRGWYLDLPDIPASGGAERVALVDPVLEGNILTFATNIPESGICLASGRSKLYQLAIRTCNAGKNFPEVASGSMTPTGNSLIVGMSRIKLPDGTIKILITGSDGTLTTQDSGQNITPAFSGRRVTWRELIRD